MFRSLLAGKSRHRAAIVAGALAGALAPLAAHASLTVQMSLSPTAAGIATTSTTAYLTQASSADVPVYVYATVTGTNPADFQGLQYLYYNVNNVVTNASVATVNATTTTPATAFTGAQFGPASPGGNGPISSQLGAIVNTAGGVSVGDTGTTLTNMNKPMSTSNAPVFVSGSSATYLVETLQVKPSAFNASTVVGTTVTLNATRFNTSIPTAAAFSAAYGPEYSEANWNEDSTTNTGSVGSQKHVTTSGTDTTGGSYSVNGLGVTIIDSMSADLNGDGSVNGGDFNILAANFNKPGTFAQGDITGDGNVNGADFNILASQFNKTLTLTSPNQSLSPLALFAESIGDTAGFNAAISAVPEPTSATLLAIGGAALLGRRKRKTQ